MNSTSFYRPIAQTDRHRPAQAMSLAGGDSWFSHVEVLHYDRPAEIAPASAVPLEILTAITSPRANLCGLDLNVPNLMGVLNVTPDSFSDGGRFDDFEAALQQASTMVAQGADIIDIGGESTRPGADIVTESAEITRAAPVITALKASGLGTPISIDTRKAGVAKAAVKAGALMINDVSALSYDGAMLELIKSSDLPVCLMHASGDPKTMQDKPEYDNVLLDVYTYLAGRVAYCVSHGIDRSRILIDPGIGFGKTTDHNLALIRGLSLFHGLGCGLLLGVSRKRFIGDIGQESQADLRAAGSIALGLEGVRQGVQILRAHDIRETKQALRLWQASR